jgi:hypothetical protein
MGTCTFNVMLHDAGTGQYMATAGHCATPTKSASATTSFPNDLVQAWDGSNWYSVGRFVYALYNETFDFGLIRLFSSVAANPAVCHFGGPLGIFVERVGTPVPLVHYGSGLALREIAPARTALAPNTLNPYWVLASGVAIFGDSGSPVLESFSGEVVGVLSDVGAVFAEGAVGNLFITRLQPQLLRAKSDLGLAALDLVTADYGGPF